MVYRGENHGARGQTPRGLRVGRSPFPMRAVSMFFVMLSIATPVVAGEWVLVAPGGSWEPTPEQKAQAERRRQEEERRKAQHKRIATQAAASRARAREKEAEHQRWLAQQKADKEAYLRQVQERKAREAAVRAQHARCKAGDQGACQQIRKRTMGVKAE